MPIVSRLIKLKNHRDFLRLPKINPVQAPHRLVSSSLEDLETLLPLSFPDVEWAELAFKWREDLQRTQKSWYHSGRYCFDIRVLGSVHIPLSRLTSPWLPTILFSGSFCILARERTVAWDGLLSTVSCHIAVIGWGEMSVSVPPGAQVSGLHGWDSEVPSYINWKQFMS